MKLLHVFLVVAASLVLYIAGTILLVDRLYRRLRSAWM